MIKYADMDDLVSYTDFMDDVDSRLAVVRDRAQRFIEQQIWGPITHNDLDKWLSNFSDPEEKFLSALLLDQFSFRSDKQSTALLRHAFVNCLPNAIQTSTANKLNAPDYLNQLQRRECNHSMRIVPVIRDLDPPTKSGPSVARLYKRSLQIVDANMIWPWQIEEYIEKGVSIFILIDDVVGTGQQFVGFWKKHIDRLDVRAKFLYIPLLAHEEGLKKISSEIPRISVQPVEIADSESNFFNRPETARIFDLKDLYLKIAKKIINPRLFKKMALGYDDLSLSIGFSHATPNATLPLYWYEDKDFYPLVGR